VKSPSFRDAREAGFGIHHSLCVDGETLV
jgi:hypothetical protein